MDTQKLKANIWKLRVVQSLRWFLLSVPILVPFYQSNGLSMQQILTLQAAFGIALALLEVPTGYLADSFGRKQSMVLGLAFWTLGWGWYGISSGFHAFILAEVLLALGTALLSGADSALLYDTLNQLGKPETYTKQEGFMNSLWNVSEGTASIIGGFLAVISLRFPIYIQALVGLLAIAFVLSLFEPKKQNNKNQSQKNQTLLRTLKFALVDHTEIKWLTLYSAFVSCAGITFLWFIQPQLETFGVPLAWFGVIWALLQFCAALVSMNAHKIEQKIGRKTILIILLPLIAISYLLLAFTTGYVSIAIMFIPYFVRGLNIPILKGYINNHTPEDIRATVLSLSGLIMRVLFIAIGPLAGYLHDHISFTFSFSVIGGLFMVMSVYSLVRMHQLKLL